MPRYFDKLFWFSVALYGIPFGLLTAGASVYFRDSEIPFWLDFLTAAIGFGFLWSLFTTFIGRRLFNSVLIKTPFGEKLELAATANYLENKRLIGGKMVITDQHILFKGHKINSKKCDLQIPLSEIKEISEKNKWYGLLNSQILIETVTHTYFFSFHGRQAVFSTLQDLRLAKNNPQSL